MVTPVTTSAGLYDAIKELLDGVVPRWQGADALRAVVELHKPVPAFGNLYYAGGFSCGGCDPGAYADSEAGAPCSTLLLIAERLGVTVTG